LYAQNTPVVSEHFDLTSFGAHSLVWGFAQDTKGVLYLANNAGIVVYDGAHWDVVTTARPARTVAIDAQNKIYVGCKGDLGWIVLKDDNQLHFESLLDRLPKESRDFIEVSKIYADTLGAHFVTEKSVLYIGAKGGDWREVKLPSAVKGAAKTSTSLFVNTANNGLMRLVNGNAEAVQGGAIFAGKNLLSAYEKNPSETILSFSDESFYLLKKSGISQLTWPTITAFGKANQTIETVALPDGNWALATLRGGVAVVGNNESIRAVLNKKSGLPDDNIFSAFADKSGNLWIGHAKGLSRYMPVAPVRIFTKEQGLSGIINDIRYHNGEVFVATIQGVYMRTDKGFVAVQGIQNECWQMDVVADKLLVAANDGLYEINGNKAKRVVNESYCLSVVGAALGHAGWLASDAGVTPLDVKRGGITVGAPINLPTQDITVLRKTQAGELLILTGDKGTLLYGGEGKEATSYNSQAGLPEGVVDAYSIAEGMLISTGKALFTAAGPTEKAKKLEGPFAHGTSDFALLGTNGEKIVVAHGKAIGLASLQGGTAEVEVPGWASFARKKAQAACIVGRTLYVGVKDQLYQISNLDLLPPVAEMQTVIHSVRRANNDSLLVSGRQSTGLAGFEYQSPAKPLAFNADNNSLTFDYALADFIQAGANEFRYRLVGQDSTWSAWSGKTSVTFNGLAAGSYHFEVQGRNTLEQLAAPASFSFTIEKPLWQTTMAFVVYGLLGFGFVYLAARMYARRAELRAAKLEVVVNERTREVNQQKEQIEAQVKELNQKNRTLDEAFQELNEKNTTLDKAYNELNEKNASLDKALRDLKDTQDQLVQNEKMASLGQLVAGVAHEINTPVGIGVTAASNLDFKAKEFARKVESGQVRKTDFDSFVKNALESSDIILINLKRAAELIQSFKKVAVDQSHDELRTINLYSYIHEVLFSLSPQTKPRNIEVILEGDQQLEFATYASGLSQIIINLVMNTLVHAFDEGQAGEVRIRFAQENNKLKLTFSDNGKGIKPDVLPRIFDPFFTTNRTKGGSGLGLNIVFNLISNKMKGSIRAESEVGKGTTFLIELPTTLR
jgi:signal transduction histidine kinase/ligand-binding sensor domain-containing protein